MFKGAPFVPLCLVGFLPKFCPCHSPVWETSGSPFVSQTGARNVWWSNLPQMCKNMTDRRNVIQGGGEYWSAEDGKERGPFHSSQVLTDGPTSHFPSFYTMYLSALMPHILHEWFILHLKSVPTATWENKCAFKSVGNEQLERQHCVM